MSDTELDAELLALAGGDDESLAGDNTQLDVGGSRPASTSPSPPPAAEESRQTPPPTRRGVAAGKKSVRGSAKKRRNSDSEEEGEASSGPATPESQQSAAMSMSSASSPAASESDNEMMFPIEGKFRNEKDRATIMALPEMEREMLLADRAAESERQQQDLHLKRLLQQREREEAGKKRKAGLADLDDSARKSSRPKTKTSEALETYKRAREERTAKKPKDARKKGHRRSVSQSSSEPILWKCPCCLESGQIGDDCRFCPYNTYTLPEELRRLIKERRNHEARDRALGDRLGNLEEYNKIRIGRSYFPQICFYPGFETMALGAFARVCGGVDETTKQPYYRMCRIEGFHTGEPYCFSYNGGPLFVDQYAILGYGNTKKTFRFDMCSNGNFTEDEFNRYRRALADAGWDEELSVDLHDKCDEIAHFLEKQWTYEQIQQKLSKQNKYQQLRVNKLEELHAQRLAATPHVQTMSRLEERNRANRKLNEQTARRAQLDAIKEQRRRRKMAEAREKRQKEEEMKVKTLAVPGKEGGGSGIDDLFEGGSEISRAATPAGGAKDKEEKKKTDKPVIKREREKVNGIPTFSKRAMDDDLIGAMDLGIDIEI